MFDALKGALTKKKPKNTTSSTTPQAPATTTPASDHLASSLPGDSIAGAKSKSVDVGARSTYVPADGAQASPTPVGGGWAYLPAGGEPAQSSKTAGQGWDYLPAGGEPAQGSKTAGQGWDYLPAGGAPEGVVSAPPPLVQAGSKPNQAASGEVKAGGGLMDHYGPHYAVEGAQAGGGALMDHYGSHYAVEGAGGDQVAPPPAPPAVKPEHRHDPFGLGPGPLVTSPLQEEFRGEHVGMETKTGHLPITAQKPTGGFLHTPTTAYAPDASVHAAPIQDGRIQFDGAWQTPEHPARSVPSARGANDGAKKQWTKDKEERFNYAMDPHGGLYLSDPQREAQRSLTPPDAAGNQTGVRINHSTMLAGGDAAGAGTMKVNAGKVESMSDASGHYRPNVTQTGQVARKLADQGAVSPERTNIELGGKKPGERELQLSAAELLAYEGDAGRAWGRDPNAPAPEAGPRKLRKRAEPATEARKKIDTTMAARTVPGEAPDVSFATAKAKAAEAQNPAEAAAQLAAPEAAIRKRHAKKDAVMAEVRGFDPSTLTPTAPPPALVEGRARSTKRRP